MEMETSHPKKKLSHAWDFFVIPCYTLTGKSVCLLGHTDQLQQLLDKKKLRLYLWIFYAINHTLILQGRVFLLQKLLYPTPRFPSLAGRTSCLTWRNTPNMSCFVGHTFSRHDFTAPNRWRLSFYGLVRHKLPPLIFRVEISNLFKQYLCRWKNELIHWVSWVIHACTVYTFPLDDC